LWRAKTLLEGEEDTKMNKKWGSILALAVVVSMVLAACGATPEPETIVQTVEVEKTVVETVEVEKTVVETVEVEKTVIAKETVIVEVTAQPPAAGGDKIPQDQQKYYFLSANIADPFYVPGVAGFENAAEILGVDTDFVGPPDINLAAHITAWEQLNALPDTAGIFWYPVDFQASEPLVDESHEAGITVVLGAADAPYKTRDAFIGYDNNMLGALTADYIAEAIGGSGKVGSMGNLGANVVQRQAAMKARLEEAYPDIEVVEPAAHEGSVESATENLQAYMTANPDLDAIWFADGLSGSLAQVWKEYQDSGTETKFISMDMPPVTLQAVKDGIFYASIGQDTFTEEFWGLMMAYYGYNGYRLPDTVLLKPIIITKDNVAEYK
jgi:ribose transport system substrate-binding protein